MKVPPELEARASAGTSEEGKAAGPTSAELEESRTAYRDLSRSEAAAAAAGRFPELINQAIDPAPKLQEGERIVGYPTPHAAKLDLPGGGGAVVESLLPLVATTAKGDQVPVDLAVRGGEEALVPNHPIVPVRMAERLSDGLELPELGLNLIPSDHSGVPLAGQAGVEGAVAHYANVQADTDLVVKPIPLGFQTHTIIRSPASPERFFFRIEFQAQDDPTLTQLDDGTILVEGEDRVVTAIPPARARDVAGRPVSVSMRIEGNLLVLAVDHRDEKFQYPIDLDPTVADYNDFEKSEGEHNWVYETNASSVFEPEWYKTFDKLRVDNGTYPYDRNDYDYGDFASWFYLTQGVSRIYKFEADGEQWSDWGTIGHSTADAFIAIVGPSGPEDTEWHPPATACADSGCPSSGGSAGNAALFELIATQDGDNYIAADLDSTNVRIAQDEGPTVTFNTTDEEIDGKPNALYEGGQWVTTSDKARVEFSAADPGLGLSYASLSSPGFITWTGKLSKNLDGCIGVQCDPTYKVDRPVGNLPDGEREIVAHATNAAIGSEMSAKVQVDNSAPTISLSGLGANNIAGLGEETLEVQVTDGQGETKSSGLPAEASSVTLDGEEILKPGGGACSPGPCGHLREYSFVGRDIGVGEHRLSVIAVDALGNKATEEFPIVVKGSGSTVDLGPGKLNVKNGNFLLSSTDASVSGGAGTLSVTRTHESLRLTDELSPLGPNWQLGLSAWRRATRMPNGTLALTSATGHQVIFHKDGAQYVPPPEYLGWELSYDEEANTFELSSPEGSSTVFRHFGGSPSSIYAPWKLLDSDGQRTHYFLWSYYNEVLRPSTIALEDQNVPYCSEAGMPCRYLDFYYDSKTTATGDASEEWGDFKGRLSKIKLHSWDSTTYAEESVDVVEYSYDASGRLRAVWDPRVSPTLKTTYGYDSEGRVTAVSPPGQQPWILRYGAKPGNSHGDWLLAATRPGAGTAENSGGPPENVVPPYFAEFAPRLSVPFHAWVGEWDGDPASYAFQWERCDTKGEACSPIQGATGQSYKPQSDDVNSTLRVTVSASNAVGATSAQTEVSAVVELEPERELVLEFGDFGTESHQLREIADIAVDDEGDLWLTDRGNDRIAKYSATGEFLAAYGSPGSEGGQFKSPEGVAVLPSGNLLVVDKGNDRIQELSPEGEFIQEWGGSGEGPGQFNEPTSLGLIPDFLGNPMIYVSDTGNDRVQRAWAEGDYGTWAGSTGSGNGQFKSPRGIATVGYDILVVDSGNNRVQEFGWNGSFQRAFGISGNSPGQFNSPYGLATVDAGQRLAVAGGGNWRVDEFDIEGNPRRSTTGEELEAFEQFVVPKTIEAEDSGSIYIGDGHPIVGTARVSKWLEPSPEEEEPPPLELPDSAVWSVAYDILGAPGSLNVFEAWGALGQTDLPDAATAIFPPDQVPIESPPSSLKRATVYYMNEAGQITNTQAPGNRVSTEEHDEFGNVIRMITPANRARVLAAESGHKALAEQLDTQLTYSEDASKLLSVIGPKREVELESGEHVEARLSTKYFYDEGAPEQGGPYNLVTKQTEGALVGEEEHDVRTKSFSYSGQEGLGWELRQPTAETVDPGGLNLTTKVVYDEDGRVLETRMPAGPEGGDAHATQTTYYTGGESEVEGCGGRPDLEGLVCQTRPAAQPETPGLPDLPVTTTEYNIYHQPTVTTEVVGEAVRTATVEYDDVGRPLSTQITATSGKALPKVQTLYDEETGLPTVQSTETEAIIRDYDSLGQLTSYTDADGNTSTFSYDALGRPTEAHDGKGAQTFSYDTTTGDLEQVEDSGAGAFSAEYDAGGKMTSMAYPNGLEARYTYDSGGSATALEYVDTTECGEGCTWFKDEAMPSIHGETLSKASTLADLDYAYDAAGRLVEAEETPQGEGCVTRLYAYDANTNRTGMTTREPAEGGACAISGGETQTNAFDEADRLIGEGIVYDDFGNITELPGEYAGGKGLASTYYADDSAASLSQNGVTIEYLLDPVGRERESVTDDGESESSLVSHFSGDGDSPAWTEDGSGNWTRYIGAMGGLGAIQSSTEGIDLQISDLNGHIVATAEPEEAEGLNFIGEATEYGVPKGEESPAKYSWLGSAQRSTELESGVVNMGARTYVPEIGRFLQTDPVSGGSANAYAYVHGDPVGETDLSGEYTPGKAAPSWLRGVMEEPPGMPPPPPPPPVETELIEEMQLGAGASISLFTPPVSVIPSPGPDIAAAVKAAYAQFLPIILRAAGQVIARFGRAAGAAFKTAVRFSINAAKGGARTAKSAARWARQEFARRGPELAACAHAAFKEVMSHPPAPWSAKIPAAATACALAIRRYRRE